MSEFINARMNYLPPRELTPLEKAKADMDYYRHKGGFAYKQAKAHYERLLRKERRNAR